MKKTTINQISNFSITVVLTIFLANGSLKAQSSFISEKKLPMLSLSFSEFETTVDESINFISRINGGLNDNDISITVTSNNKQQSFKGYKHFKQITFVKANEIRLSYNNAEKPIESVDIDFRDFRRSVIVAGKNQHDVDIVANDISDSFLPYKAHFTGSWLRLTIGLTIFFIAFYFSTGYQLYQIKNGIITYKKVNNLVRDIIGWALTIVWLSMLFEFIPLADYFPGFEILKDNTPFLAKYSPELSFLGLILAIATLPYHRWTKSKVSEPTVQPINNIIALRAKASSGKSTTIRILYERMIQTGYSLQSGNFRVEGGDFTAILSKNGKLIGITSSGDTYDLVHENLQRLISVNCTICVCACRTFGGTNKAILEFSNYSNQFIEKTLDDNPNTQLPSNTGDAQNILSIVDSLI